MFRAALHAKWDTVHPVPTGGDPVWSDGALKWSQGPSPRGFWKAKARAGRRTGKACHKRPTGYGSLYRAYPVNADTHYM